MARRKRVIEARAAVPSCYISPDRHRQGVTMKGLKCAAIVAAVGFCGAAYCADGSVTISSPAEGAKVGLSGIKLDYDVVPGPKGDHVHVYVDGEEASLLRQLKGSYTVEKLTAGKHTLCVRVVDKGHTPVGLEKCVQVVAGNVPAMGY
jgi:hypothetical protein